MKCTLRKVSEGIVATIDEPKYNDWAYYINGNGNITQRLFYLIDYIRMHKQIIASTIPNVGKELLVDTTIAYMYIVYLSQLDESELDFNKEYDYTETETTVVIKL